MLDVHAARESYENREIYNIEFVRSSAYLAHGFIKEKMQSAILIVVNKITDYNTNSGLLR